MQPVIVIPARGGSKRLPGKNLRPLFGVPIISRVVEVCIESRCFSEIVVSTDSSEIADVARCAGATVNGLRPEKLSTDESVLLDVLRYEVEEMRHLVSSVDIVAMALPTAALLSSSIIRRAIAEFQIDETYSAALTLARSPVPPELLWSIADGRASANVPQAFGSSSQHLRPAYFDAGMLYLYRVDYLFKNQQRAYTHNLMPIVIPTESAVDINTEDDWTRAEFAFAYSRRREGHAYLEGL